MAGLKKKINQNAKAKGYESLSKGGKRQINNKYGSQGITKRINETNLGQRINQRIFSATGQHDRVNKIVESRIRSGLEFANKDLSKDEFYAATSDLWRGLEETELRNKAIIEKLGVNNLQEAIKRVEELFKTTQKDFSTEDLISPADSAEDRYRTYLVALVAGRI